jgi:hypothetical protein
MIGASLKDIAYGTGLGLSLVRKVIERDKGY